MFNIDGSVEDIFRVLTDSSGWVFDYGNLMKKQVNVGGLSQTVFVAIKREFFAITPVYNLTKIVTSYAK